MNILFVVLEDFPGGDTRVRRQAKALRDRGHEITVLCARGYSTETDWDGCTVVRTWTRREKGGSMRRRLGEYAAFTFEATLRVLLLAVRRRIDVVQVANMPDFLVFAAAPARLLRRSALVLDLHDLMPELLSSKASAQSAWHGAVRWQESRSIRYADMVMTVNDLCVRILHSRNAGQAVAMIPNSPDASTFPLCPPKPLDRTRRIRIGYHGTVARRFGVACLLRASALLLERGLDLELHVWGGGDELDLMRKLVDSLKIGHAVTLHGQTPVQQLVAMLQTIDVSAVPYEADPYMAIAYSTKAFELAALGIPMVVSDLPGIREQFSDEAVTYFQAGNETALADALWSVIENPDQGRQRAIRAQYELKRYAWERFSVEYVAVIERLYRHR